MEPASSDDVHLRIYWKAILARLDVVPGVRSSATILHLPTSGRAWNANIVIEGRPLPPDEPPPVAHWQTVSTNYFRTAGVPLLHGRQFDETDGPEAPLVIAVNSAFASRVFGDSDPIGHRIRAGNATRDSMATIVAVVGSVRHDSLTAPAGPEVYVPFNQRTVVATSLVVRTSVPPYLLVPAIREQIWAVDRNVPISDVRTMDDRFAASLARQRMLMILFALFAGVGLFLSSVGVYGVVAFGAAQRVKEIGIRMALGADAPEILRLVLWHGFRYAILGAAVGVPLALALSGAMRGMVYGVPTTDWMSFVSAPVGLMMVVVAASWIPARRAAALPPTVALAE
jgi:predicted permease